MVVTGPRSNAPQKNCYSDANENKRCQGLLYVNPLPQARHRKTHPDQNPKALDWDTIDLANSLQAQRNNRYSKQSSAQAEVRKPGNSYPNEERCPPHGVKSAASFI